MDGTKHDTGPGRSPQFSFTKEQRRVSVFYIYIWDARMGPGFIKICTYFPYPVKAWVNGTEWAKRQALAAGISFTELSNGFASCDDPAALQQICDRFGPGTVQVWFERWMARLPLPLTYADRDAGFRWEVSMRQVETSRTLVFSTDVRARAFFEALLCENMDLGRPERAELLFRRGQRRGVPNSPPRDGFKTRIDQYCSLVTMNINYKNSHLKQYLKDGIALRIETVINNPNDLGCNKQLHNLPELQDKARAINARLLETETAGQDTALVSPALSSGSPGPPSPAMGGRRPHCGSATFESRPWPALPPPTPFTVTGITNKTLRGLMTGLLHRPYSMNQASYDLSRAGEDRPHRPRPGPQPLHPHPRRAAVRHLLHPGPATTPSAC